MKRKKWDVYIYGDVNIDLVIPGVDHFPKPGQEEEVATMETFVGGGAALFTLGLGKLGMHPVFQGEVGDDCYGELIVQEFYKKNVDCKLLKRSKTEKTGISISFTNEKDRSFLTYRGTNARISIREIQMDHVMEARHIHVTGYEGTANHKEYLELLKRVKNETDATVSFDLGWDASGEWYGGIDQLFPYIDVLFMNEMEAVHYSRKETAKEAAEIFAQSCGIAVIKMGRLGSLAVKKGTYYEAASFAVRAVDTTGAGDSFNAGFIYGFLNGFDPQTCLEYGNGCGALNVTALGGNTGFPDKETLHQFIKSQKKRD